MRGSVLRLGAGVWAVQEAEPWGRVAGSDNCAQCWRLKSAAPLPRRAGRGHMAGRVVRLPPRIRVAEFYIQL